MATGLQYKENLTLISGGYTGEDIGSDGLVQDWVNTTGDSGSSTVVYHYTDSASLDNSNSSRVDVAITDSWTAELLSNNTYRITVNTTIASITRTKIGSPTAYSTSIFVRQSKNGANVWTSGGCDDATTSHTIATNIDVGTHVFDLPPESVDSSRGTVYYRSNACGHDGDTPPSQYVDEFWLGVNFRNTLPKDYIPGKVWDGSQWLSHNRATNGHVKIWNGSSWSGDLRTVDGGTGTNNPPLIRHGSDWKNMRKIGNE